VCVFIARKTCTQIRDRHSYEEFFSLRFGSHVHSVGSGLRSQARTRHTERDARKSSAPQGSYGERTTLPTKGLVLPAAGTALAFARARLAPEPGCMPPLPGLHAPSTGPPCPPYRACTPPYPGVAYRRHLIFTPGSCRPRACAHCSRMPTPSESLGVLSAFDKLFQYRLGDPSMACAP
jgi:hypothetical protein